MPSFCVNCGRPYEAFEKFCNSCGKPLPRPNLDIPQNPETNKLQEHSTSLPPHESEPTPEEQFIEPPPIPIEKEVISPSIPFARLTLFSALAIVCLSTVSFAVFDDIYRGKAYLLPFACVVLIACAASLGQARSSWLKIAAYGVKGSLPLRLRRKLVIGLSIFAVLTLGGGMILGAQVGMSGAETESYIADLALYRSLGDKVSAARNAASGTIEGQLAMYAQIEPELRSLSLVVERLKTENRVYAMRYPAAQATTTSSAEAFERTSKRGELLLQQIAIAKEIEQTQGHDAQLALYRAKMMPVLTAEDHLDGR
jgi:hypothetical protein